MKKILIIKADTNDADYITNETEVTGYFNGTMANDFGITDSKETFLEWLARVAKALEVQRKKHNHNWPMHCSCRGESPKQLYKDILSEDDVNIFDEFVPHGEDGIHTIESIRILTISADKELMR